MSPLHCVSEAPEPYIQGTRATPLLRVEGTGARLEQLQMPSSNYLHLAY